MAAAMGMTGTHFVNMNGLTENGHYSTARDMSRFVAAMLHGRKRAPASEDVS